ncbi:MAG: hypothetical protein DHS20C08_04480 [Rhodomicrobium sp.]|nr:MAG: hypothetical protein DHS20C08_04480 [Rhodomicrobium sp.]
MHILLLMALVVIFLFAALAIAQKIHHHASARQFVKSNRKALRAIANDDEAAPKDRSNALMLLAMYG